VTAPGALGFSTPVFKGAFGYEGSGEGGLYQPRDVATDAEGTIWVADTGNNRIQHFSPQGEYLGEFGEEGSWEGALLAPTGVATDAEGNIWVADAGNNRIQQFDPEGGYVTEFGFFSGRPGDLHLDSEGNLWVSFSDYGCIVKYAVAEQPQVLGWVCESVEPRGLAADAEGNIWVADTGKNRIQHFSPEGEYLGEFGEEGSWEGALLAPTGVATDAEGNIWVADTGNNRIQQFSPQGEYLDEFGEEGFGEGQFLEPSAVTTDSEDNLWVADSGNNRIQRWSHGQEATAVTGAATAIGASGATLNGTVNTHGLSTFYVFQYGTTTAYGKNGPGGGVEAGIESKKVSGEITGLEPGTTYHFRLRTLNAKGLSDGDDRTFTTTAAPPTATTSTASNVMAEQATLNATVNPKGAATDYQFEYGTTTAYGSKAPATAKAAGSGSEALQVEETVAGLSEGTTYHYRVVAENEAGTTYGEDRSFETPLLPDVETEGSEGVNANEAILEGTIDPNGMDTEYTFEYGPTTAYGSAGPTAEEGIGSGNEAVEVIAAPAHLEPETTYHYRIVATSDAGVEYGEDQTLTTSARVDSPQVEAEKAEEEVAFTSKFATLPADFVGVQWSGNPSIEANEAEMEVINQSGAKVLRFGFNWNFHHNLDPNWAIYDKVFQYAGARGIKVLPQLDGNPSGGPGFPTTESGKKEWLDFVEEAWNRYGSQVSHWEVGNENNYYSWNPNGRVDPELFGEHLSETKAALDNAANGDVNVILGGLISLNRRVVDGTGAIKQLRVSEFLDQMHKGRNAFMALGLHPYAFLSDGHEPRTTPQVIDIKEKVREYIYEARAALDATNQGTKRIWITELGWPVEEVVPDPGHPKVTEDIQRELIKKSFEMIMARSTDYKINHVLYYNDIDLANESNWAYHCGLRKANGEFRKGWYGFRYEALRDENYPRPPHAKTKGNVRHPNRATLFGEVNPEGLSTVYYFQYGVASSSQTQTTAPKTAGFTEQPVQVGDEITGLSPETAYRYRVVAVNANGESTPGEYEVFTTPPSSDTGATVKQTLNGEPGWVSVGGYIHEGAEEGSVGPPIAGAWLNVNFQKWEGGEWVTKSTDHPVTNSEGYYETQNWSVGKGEWRTRTVFPPQLGYQESMSGYHEFTIKNGYQLVAKHSGKCLDVSNSNTANGAALIQWECNSPQTAQNQVFKLVPQGNSYYQLVARHSNRCVDVPGASQTQGVTLQQYDCLGAGQTNQIWQGVPIETIEGNEYVHFVAKHSGQCMEVQSSSNANGAPVGQWPCIGNQANQLWTFKSVESNDIETHTYLTPGETLNGHPGYQSISGSVDLGAYSTAGKWVNVNFSKEVSPGNYQYVSTIEPHPTLNAAGQYSYNWWGVSTGNWRVRTVFPGEGALASSESNYHYFHIGDGYRFKFRHSGRCLSTSGGGTANGTALIQWDCSPSPNPADGQVYSIVPQGGGYWQIRPDSNTNKCVDVAGASQSNGAQLQLWDCLGAGQTNQIWNIIPISGQPGWFASIAKHSNKCMDVYGAQTGNGAIVHQWDCHWGGNQQWQWQSIG
jgi:sugar lactone lactonase YvrE